MKVRALMLFRDKKEGVVRKQGDTFNVTKGRFKEINSTKHGLLVEEVIEEKAKEKVKEEVEEIEGD